MSALRVFINEPFYERFDTIFIRNKKKKNFVKILIDFFFFS